VDPGRKMQASTLIGSKRSSAVAVAVAVAVNDHVNVNVNVALAIGSRPMRATMLLALLAFARCKKEPAAGMENGVDAAAPASSLPKRRTQRADLCPPRLCDEGDRRRRMRRHRPLPLVRESV
jgi:hypothetical protein